MILSINLYEINFEHSLRIDDVSLNFKHYFIPKILIDR